MINKFTGKQIAEWGGCLGGLAGALLLSLNISISGWGFVLYLISNVFMFAYGFIIRSKGIILMQIGFTITSSLGVWNWIMK